MNWRVVFTPKAERDLKRLPEADKQRIKDEMTALAEEPYPRLYVKKLKGYRNTPIYALRVGRYRVILTIEDDVMVIFVIEIGNRSKVHRRY